MLVVVGEAGLRCDCRDAMEAVVELMDEEAPVLSAPVHSFASALSEVPVVTQYDEGEASVERPSVLLDAVGSSQRPPQLRDAGEAIIVGGAAVAAVEVVVTVAAVTL